MIIRDIVDYCKLQSTLNNASNQTWSTAFFYFSFTDTEKQQTCNLICSLLVQLARSLPRISESLWHLYDQYKRGKPPFDSVKNTLRAILETIGQAFLIIDALDECVADKGRIELLAVLAEIKEWAFPNLRVLVTSRKDPEIDEVLRPLVTFKPICIQTKKVQHDAQLYVRCQLTADYTLKKWSTTVKKEIEEILVEGANGMYAFFTPSCLNHVLICYGKGSYGFSVS